MSHPQTPCVLVAEDETIIRLDLCQVLSQHGYCVLEAQDGSEALRLARAYDGLIHALITEIQMPSLDGHALIRQLKPERPDLRVLIFSSLSEWDFAVDAQYDAYLPKPIDLKFLAYRVEQLLTHEHPRSVDMGQPDRVQTLCQAWEDKRITLPQFRVALMQLSAEELRQLSPRVCDWT